MEKRFNGRALVGAGLAAGVGAANAAVDVTAITGSITDITAVGVAVLAVAVAIKLYKWVRRAL
jgi:Zn-dependent alcohol dehydrogenase